MFLVTSANKIAGYHYDAWPQDIGVCQLHMPPAVQYAAHDLGAGAALVTPAQPGEPCDWITDA